MKYILHHSSGQYQLNTSLPFDEFKKTAALQKQSISLFHLSGQYAGAVNAAFLEACLISGEDFMVPVESMRLDDGGQGFLAIKYPFEKEKVLEILNKMNINYDSDSKEAIQYYVTDEPEEFLTLYRNTTYIKGTFKRCVISEKNESITFLTEWGFMIDPTKVMFAITGQMVAFNFSERYNMYFIPAAYNSEPYNKYL